MIHRRVARRPDPFHRRCSALCPRRPGPAAERRMSRSGPAFQQSAIRSNHSMVKTGAPQGHHPLPNFNGNPPPLICPYPAPAPKARRALRDRSGVAAHALPTHPPTHPTEPPGSVGGLCFRARAFVIPCAFPSLATSRARGPADF